MNTILFVRNTSGHRAPVRRDALVRLVEKACHEEGIGGQVEVSLLYCTDPFIQDLNKTYRKKNKPTDVLSFTQELPAEAGPRVLGDIVISLDTVVRHCAETGESLNKEVHLLFCHGLLHLLGYDHATAAEQAAMAERQAACLGVPLEAAWPRPRKSGRKKQ